MGAILDKFRDTTARKPSGWLGKLMYRNPKGHYRSFQVIMERLNLKGDDSYLEIACGGGVLLEMALQTVGRAAAIDHSSDMVELATQRNREAVDMEIVEIVAGKAESLPWPDENFSCAACANAFFFIEHPEQVLKEICRVLKPGGRLVINTVPGKSTLVSTLFTRPFNLKSYPDEKMKHMLSTAGFNIAEVNTISGMQVCYAMKGST